jgi:photosystem II stability/assembly factor-like uncharacterized protein
MPSDTDELRQPLCHWPLAGAVAFVLGLGVVALAGIGDAVSDGDGRHPHAGVAAAASSLSSPARSSSPGVSSSPEATAVRRGTPPSDAAGRTHSYRRFAPRDRMAGMDRLYATLPGTVAVVDVETDDGTDAVVNTDGATSVDATVVRTTTPHPDASLQCVAASPVDLDVVCCGTADHGLFRSVDAGTTWHRADGVEQDRVTNVTCATLGDADRPRDGRVAWWAGTEPSHVYRSPDGAAWTECAGLTDLPSASSWAFPPRPQTHHVRWIEVDPHDPGHLYVAVEAGALVETHDGGKTWTDRVPTSPRDTHSMATHPDAPDRAYCAAGDGYAETVDGGETWTYPQEGLDHRYCWSVVVDPAEPDRRLLSAARGPMTAHSAASADSHVYRRRGAEPWKPVEGLPTGSGITRYVLGRGTGGFYALSNAGLFQSAVGEAWDRLPLDVADDTVAAGLAVVG